MKMSFLHMINRNKKSTAFPLVAVIGQAQPLQPIGKPKKNTFCIAL